MGWSYCVPQVGQRARSRSSSSCIFFLFCFSLGGIGGLGLWIVECRDAGMQKCSKLHNARGGGYAWVAFQVYPGYLDIYRLWSL